MQVTLCGLCMFTSIKCPKAFHLFLLILRMPCLDIFVFPLYVKKFDSRRFFDMQWQEAFNFFSCSQTLCEPQLLCELHICYLSVPSMVAHHFSVNVFHAWNQNHLSAFNQADLRFPFVINASCETHLAKEDKKCN